SFGKGNNQLGGILTRGLKHYQHHSHQDAYQDLIGELAATSKSEIAVMDDLQIVVGETDGRKAERGDDRDPNIFISQVGPKQCRNNDGDGNEHHTHRRSAGFFLMSSRSLFTDVLSDLKVSELANHARANDQSDKKCSQTCKNRAEGEIAKNTKR